MPYSSTIIQLLWIAFIFNLFSIRISYASSEDDKSHAKSHHHHHKATHTHGHHTHETNFTVSGSFAGLQKDMEKHGALQINILPTTVNVPNATAAMLDPEHPCFPIFNTTDFRWLCVQPHSYCLCNIIKLREQRSNRFAILQAGGLRTTTITYPSFRHFVMKPNAPVDMVFLTQNFDASDPNRIDAIREILEDATVIVAHRSRAYETMRDYTARMNRTYHYQHQKLDEEIQAKHSTGGIVDMWTNMELGYKLTKQISLHFRDKPHELVLKTRPDHVYFSYFRFAKLTDPSYYNRPGIYQPFYNFHYRGLPVMDKKQYLPIRKEPLTSPPLFFPDCACFDGLTDRLFVGPPALMDIVLDAEWVKNMISVDMEKLEKVHHGVRGGFIGLHKFGAGMGLEGPLLSWIIWNQLPLAVLPHYDQTAFYFGILRTGKVGDYCKGNYAMSAFFSDAVCLLGDCSRGKPPIISADKISSDGFRAVANELIGKCPNSTLDNLQAPVRMTNKTAVVSPKV